MTDITLSIPLEGEGGANDADFTPKVETQLNGWQTVDVFNYVTGRLQKFHRPNAALAFRRFRASGVY